MADVTSGAGRRDAPARGKSHSSPHPDSRESAASGLPLDDAAVDTQLRARSLTLADPDEAAMLDVVSKLSQRHVPEADALSAELAPILLRLAGRAHREAPPLADPLQPPEMQFQAFRRERTAQMARAVLADSSRILISPDVRAAGLLPDTRRVEDERRAGSRTVRIELDYEVGRRLAGVRKYWPALGSDDLRHRRVDLWANLVGLLAACPADHLGMGEPRSISAALSLVTAALADKSAERSLEPPSAPSVYAGYLNSGQSAEVVKMQLEERKGRVYLSAGIDVDAEPVVIALQEGRTHGRGAVNGALAFEPWFPEEAESLVDAFALGDNPSIASPAETGDVFAEGGASHSISDETWSIRVLTILRSARERLADQIRRELELAPRQRLESESFRNQTSETLALVARLDQLIPL